LTLLTAHRILIGTAVVFFAFYASWEVKRARSSGAPAGYVRAAASLAAAGGLGLYFLTLRHRNGGT